MKRPKSSSHFLAALWRIGIASALTVTAALSQTGAPATGLAAFDRLVPALLDKYGIPGASLSISKDGRLVYARGFGFADRVTKEVVQPDSLFRVASVSKPLTSIGVLKLVEDGKISLDTSVMAFIGRTPTADPRYADITVRHLLQHSAGLSITAWGFDPSFPDADSLAALGAPLPPTRGNILDFVLANLPLAFAPGTGFEYSNIGFLLLTEVIEKASGMPYETYMREKIFAPLGIVRLRIAGSLLTDRQPGEVRYWDLNGTAAPIFPGLPAQVPYPYGAFNIRIFESGGGWMATTMDLVRVLSAFDNGSGFSFLKPETVRLIEERPAYVAAGASGWYGLGWGLKRTATGTRWDHDGAFQGTSAWMFRGVNGISLAIAFNHLPPYETLEKFFGEFEAGLYETALAVTQWPAGNLFDTYFPGLNPRIAHAGVVNAASQRPGPIAAGSVALVYGVNLTPASVVRINGLIAETLWTGENQLYVRVPYTASGLTTFEVDERGRSSNRELVTVAAESPALFTTSRNGYGQAAALNQDGTANGRERRAAPGSIVVLFATGTLAPTVKASGREAAVLYSGPAPGLPAGVMQINVRLPLGIGSGEQAVVLEARGNASSAEVTLAVQ